MYLGEVLRTSCSKKEFFIQNAYTARQSIACFPRGCLAVVPGIPAGSLAHTQLHFSAHALCW